MAATSFTDLANILLTYYGKHIAKAFTEYGLGNQFMNENSIMARLAQKGRIFVGSDEVSDRYAKEWAVHTTAFSAAWFDTSDSFPSSTAPAFATASLEWKRAWITMEFDNLVRIANAVARGGIDKLTFEFQAKLKALINEIESKLSGDGTSPSTKVITGFKAFLATANTYAGIDQGANSYWRARITDASSAALSKSTHLQAVAKALYDNSAVGPNSEIWMSSTQWEKFQALYNSQLRAVAGGEASDRIMPRYADGIVDLPIYVLPSLSQSATTDEIWFVNLDEISLHFLDHSPQDALVAEPDKEVMHEGVPVGIEEIETGKDTKALALKAYCQLVCLNPRNQGAIINLAT